MEISKSNHIINNGIYYTPIVLAKHLARPLLSVKNVSVFDPAYGEGSLLLAAESVIHENKNGKVNLYGCDTHPINGLLEHLPKANLEESDFFDYSLKKKYDVILTNPPYVRRQNQNKELIKEYRDKYSELGFLSKNADLWAYFIVKSVLHIKENGSFGAIIPWSFLQANYAQELRIWLFDKFEYIKVLAINEPYFKLGDERVVLLWMRKYGKSTKSIKLGFTNKIGLHHKYLKLHKNSWLSNKIVMAGNNSFDRIFSQLQKTFGFTHFSNYAHSRIGIVTGANDFFIREMKELKEIGFEDSQLIPVLNSAKDLPRYLKEGDKELKRLICITENNGAFDDFIKEGVEANYHQRVHCKMRYPWYSIKKSKVPDAFFPYRIGKIPFLVINNMKIQSTNSIHRIYFNNLSIIEIKWIHISLLSIYGQLSIEANVKTYGKGMCKIEPGSLGKVLVLARKDRSIVKIYAIVIKLLMEDNKKEAVKLATSFINSTLAVPIEFKKISEATYESINNLRNR